MQLKQNNVKSAKLTKHQTLKPESSKTPAFVRMKDKRDICSSIVWKVADCSDENGATHCVRSDATPL